MLNWHIRSVAFWGAAYLIQGIGFSQKLIIFRSENGVGYQGLGLLAGLICFLRRTTRITRLVMIVINPTGIKGWIGSAIGFLPW